MDALYRVATQFTPVGTVKTVHPYGAGNVNDTFLVTTDSNGASSINSRFILQRINTHVFRQPTLIVANMRTFTEHVRTRLTQENATRERWEVPTVIATGAGQDHFVDQSGAFWRAITMIEQAKTYPSIRDASHARESGYALGRFQSLISDLDTDQLHDTLPGFHITPQYLAHYDTVLAQPQTYSDRIAARIQDVQHCMRFVEQRRGLAATLEDAQAQGKLTLPRHPWRPQSRQHFDR